MSLILLVILITTILANTWLLIQSILALLPWIALAGLAWLAYCHRDQIARCVDFLHGRIKRSSLRSKRT